MAVVTWQLGRTITLNLGARYDLDLTPTTVNQYIGAYNERIVARRGGKFTGDRA